MSLKDLKMRISDGFQVIGPSIMPIIAILPAAGFALGIGSALQQERLISLLPFLGCGFIQILAQVLNAVGNLIIGNLGVLFAIGIAMNLTGKSGMAALSSFICFMVMNISIGIFKGITAEKVASSTAYATVLGINTYQTGVFGGLVVGFVVAYLYNKFHRIEFKPSMAFFQGERFIPILSLVSGIVLGGVMVVLWPPVQGLFNLFTNWLTTTPLRFLAVFLYGGVMRLVQAFGLHHLIYPYFYFQMGEYVNSAGQVITGDCSIFFAQLADGVDITVGGFMAGSYISSICAAAVALATYHVAKPERKSKVKGVLLSGAITALLTGIVEPIEFTFLLISPMLWVIYSGIIGLGYAIMDLFKVRLGTALAGNAIDFVLYGILLNANNWYLLIPIGLAFFVVTYFIFRIYIVKKNLHTIGRESEEELIAEAALEVSATDLPVKVMELLGGASNIKSITNCITRVRATVYDRDIVQLDEFKCLGAKGVVTPGKEGVQIIFGGASERIANTIKDIMTGKIKA